MAETDVLTGKRGRKAAQRAARNEIQESEPPQPPARRKKESVPKTISFFERMEQFPKDDWGTRVKVKVYRLKPVTDMIVASGHKYCCIYDTYPPPTEELIKRDCGSGKYRLYLNYKAPAEGEKELDSTEIDIMDMKYPPVIPKGAWLDDPRNKDWEWARKHYEEQEKRESSGKGGNATETIMDAIEIVNGLRGQQTDPVKTTLDTIKGVREMMAPQSTPTQELQTLISVADKLRPAETVPQFMQVQFQSLQAQIQAAQERADKLMMMLIDSKKNAAENPGGISLVKEVVSGLKDLMPEVKDIFPIGENGGKQRPWWQECALLIAPYAGQFISPLGQVLAAGIANKMMTQPGVNGVQPNPGQTQQPAGQIAAGASPTMMPFLQMIAFPMVTHCRYMGPPENEDPTEVGKDFALWVFNGYGSDSRYGQAILAAKAMGPTGIIAAFRGTPLWADKGPQNTLVSLAELEAKLPAFFGAFLSFDPNAIESDDEPEETDPGRPVIVETFSEQGAGY